MKSFEERIQELNKRIKESKNIVFFGGAGVSTESGIPDFRSKDGLYNTPNVGFENYTPEYLLSDECLENEPEVFFEFCRQKLDCRNVEPNIAHFTLAKLGELNKNLTIITQNIDGLHQKAGSKNVIEIHGNVNRNICGLCGDVYPDGYIFDCKESVPYCHHDWWSPISSFSECGGIIRPDIVLYGERLPEKEWDASTNALTAADLVIVAGTSLTVFPAAYLMHYVESSKLVIINRDETIFDDEADILFHEEIGDVFSKMEI